MRATHLEPGRICRAVLQQRLLTPVLDSAKSLTLGDTYVLKLFGLKEISPLIGSLMASPSALKIEAIICSLKKSITYLSHSQGI